MGSNVVFLGWDRAVQGSEQTSGDLFREFIQYLGGLQQAGAIQSFEPVFLDPHGGDLNGFCLIRGESDKLDALLASDAWGDMVTRADLTMRGIGVIRGAAGDLLMARMARWQELTAG